MLPPETSHHLVLNVLKILSHTPIARGLLRSLFFIPDLRKKETELMGLKFKHPLGLAAGFDKSGAYIDALALLGFSFIEIGAVTPRAQAGNPKPRLFRLKQDQALINRMGFNNPGMKMVAQNLKKRKSDVIVGVNIGKNTNTPNDKAKDDYLEVFTYLHPYADFFTVNVSCPNIGDIQSLSEKRNLLPLLNEMQEINRKSDKPKPILLKLSPDLSEKQLNESIESALEAQIDGLIVVNTTKDFSMLKSNYETLRKIGNGGLSGLPLKEKATEITGYVSNQVKGKLVIIGVGGIMSPEDAKERMDAGADLIQIFTGLIYGGPYLIKKIIQAL